MLHTTIDQTSLVHDIISLQSDIKVTSPTKEPQCADLGGYDVLLYDWSARQQAARLWLFNGKIRLGKVSGLHRLKSTHQGGNMPPFSVCK